MKFQEIKTNPVDNGVRVEVGCLKLVYQQKDFKQFFRDLENYFKDPEKTEKAIRKRWGIKGDMVATTQWTTIDGNCSIGVDLGVSDE